MSVCLSVCHCNFYLAVVPNSVTCIKPLPNCVFRLPNSGRLHLQRESVGAVGSVVASSLGRQLPADFRHRHSRPAHVHLQLQRPRPLHVLAVRDPKDQLLREYDLRTQRHDRRIFHAGSGESGTAETKLLPGTFFRRIDHFGAGSRGALRRRKPLGGSGGRGGGE